MDEMQNNGQGPTAACGKWRQAATWSTVIASLLFSAVSFEMVNLYGIVHWKLMFPDSVKGQRPPEAVFEVLNHLGVLQAAFAGLGIVFAIWSFRTIHRQAAVIALIVAIAAASSLLMVM
jgi:hypothetical protein